MYRIRALSAVIIAAMLTACGGGGGGGSALPAGPSHSSPAAGKGSVKITLFVPPAKKQSARAIAYLQQAQSRKLKRPYYLSGSTTEIDFTLSTENGVAASPADQAQYDFVIYTSSSSECTGNNTNGYSCTVTVPAPVGSDAYSVQSQQCSAANTSPTASCSSLGGTLTLLSASYTTIAIALDQTVVAAFTLSPIVASIDWAPVTYATVTGPAPMNAGLWLAQPNGTNSATYNPGANSYACSSNVGPGTANGCYEPVAQGTQIAYGEVLEARDVNGALIIGASGGTVYQTPLYLTSSGSPITINWTCTDNTTGANTLTTKTVPSIVWETGGGPYSNNASTTQANQTFNSPVANPAADADGGNTVDGNGNPVTAVGNNGVEMNWDGLDQPQNNTPDSCSASTSSGLSTSADFYVGLGQGGINVQPGLTPDGTVYELNAPAGTANGPSVDATAFQTLNVFAAGQYSWPATTSVTTASEGPGCYLGSTTNDTCQDWPDGPGESICGDAAANNESYSESLSCPGASIFSPPTRDSLSFDSGANLWFSGLQTASGFIGEFAGAPNAASTPTSWLNPQPGGAGVAFDAQGNLYTTTSYNQGSYGNANENTEIAVYSNGALTRQIFGPNTLLTEPVKLTVDASGNLWVLQYGRGTLGSGSSPVAELLEFAPGANGNATPTQSVLDANWFSACGITGFSPSSFAFDPSGNLVIGIYLDWTGPSGGGKLILNTVNVIVLPAGFNDSTCPSAQYLVKTNYASTGATRPDDQVTGVAVDDKGFVYAITAQGSTVIVPEMSTNGPSGVVTPYAWFNDAATPANPGDGSAGPSAIAVTTSSGWMSGNSRSRHTIIKR